MASIRHIFVLFIFVALCHYGNAHERSKRHVGGLYSFFQKLLRPLDLIYLRFRQRFYPSGFTDSTSNDNIEFPHDSFALETLDDSSYEDSHELDDLLSNSFEDDDEYYKNSKEDDFLNLSKEKYDKNEEEHAKSNKDDGKSKAPKHGEHKPYNKKQNVEHKDEKFYKNPYLYINDEIEQLKRVIKKESSYDSPENFLLYLFKTFGFNQATFDMYVALQSPFSPLNPAPYVLNPGVPKTNLGPSFIPNSVPGFPINIPVDVRNFGAPYTYPPYDILRNLFPKINKPRNKPNVNIGFPNTNGGINNRFNPLTTPNYGNFGNKFRPNYIPIGGSIIDGYYPNPWQRMYYLVQLTNGQVVQVPKQAIFGPNKGPLAPGYRSIFLPNNNQIFAPGGVHPPIDINDYLFPFNYGLDGRYGRGSENLRQPRRIQSSFETERNIETFHDINTPAAVKDVLKLSSPDDKFKHIDDKDGESEESKHKEYNKYD